MTHLACFSAVYEPNAAALKSVVGHLRRCQFGKRGFCDVECWSAENGACAVAPGDDVTARERDGAEPSKYSGGIDDVQRVGGESGDRVR